MRRLAFALTGFSLLVIGGAPARANSKRAFVPDQTTFAFSGAKAPFTAKQARAAGVHVKLGKDGDVRFFVNRAATKGEAAFDPTAARKLGFVTRQETRPGSRDPADRFILQSWVTQGVSSTRNWSGIYGSGTERVTSVSTAHNTNDLKQHHGTDGIVYVLGSDKAVRKAP